MAFFGPALVLLTLFLFLPMLLTVIFSFTDFFALNPDLTHFVGLKNYIEIFTSDKNYLSGIGHTLMFTIVSNIVKLVPALFLAIMLQEGLKGKNFYRTILYLPSILPFVIIGITFKSVLNYDNGLLNNFLDMVHLGFLKQKWLSDLNIVWGSVIGVDAWRGIGYVMTIFIAGLGAIPKTYYEAAQIDGANFWQRLKSITLPMLTGSIMINLVFGITYGLKVFDIIYVLTNGGPGHATEVVTTYSYQMYADGAYGMSTAFNTILLILTAIAGIFVVKNMSKKEVQQ